MYVLGSTRRGFALCEYALEHDGYLNAASGESTGSGKAAAESNTALGETTDSGNAAAESNPASAKTADSAQAAVESNAASVETGSAETASESFSGALTKEDLEEALMPSYLHAHKLWANLQPHFAEWDAQAALAIKVMCALLSTTKAWTVLDQVAPNLDPAELALVGPALSNLGARSEYIAEAWQEKLLNKYIKLSEGAVAKTVMALQHMIEESMKGSFVMSEESVDKALSSAPGKKDLKRHLHRYFGNVRKFRAFLTKGSLAKAKEIDETLDDLKACKEEATAFGQELAEIGAITGSVSVARIAAHLDAMILKLTTLRKGNNTASLNALKQLNEAAKKSVAQVDVNTEKQFKEDMKKFGSKMGSAQRQLKAVIDVVKAENPGMLAAAETSTASGETREATALESACAAAIKTETTMTEYTCIYVGMTLVKNPKLRVPTQVGVSVRTGLKSALATLSANRHTNIFGKEINEIQVTLDSAEEVAK